MRLFTIFMATGGILVLAFAVSLADNLPPGVRMGQGVGTKGVVESTYGPQSPDPGFPVADFPHRFELDEEPIRAIKNRQLPVGHEQARIIEALTNRGGQQAIAAAPTLGTNFAGHNMNQCGCIPPDPAMAAGPNHIILSVNTSFAIYNKTGTQQFVQSYAAFFAGINTSGGGAFDPKVVYDHYAGRWIILALAAGSSAAAYLIAASDDSDPNGTWFKYSSPAHLDGATPTTNGADFPGIGFDSSEAVYVTSNQFTNFLNPPTSFDYSKIRIFKKSELYSNAAPPLTYTDFVGMTDPSDLGTTFTIKPVLSTGPVMGTFLVNTGGSSGNFIELWRINDPVTSPALVHRASVVIGSYSAPVDATQPSGVTPIETNNSTIQSEIQLRNGRLYFAFPQSHNFGSGTVAAIRYLEIDTVGDTVPGRNIIYGADGENHFFPAPIALFSGNVAMIFSHCSPSSFAGARYVGNFPGDMTQGTLKAGEATYFIDFGSGRNRWGDYAGIAIDPAFPRRVWLYHEYAESPASFWSTWTGFITLRNNRPIINNPSPLSLFEGDTLIDTITVTEPDGEAIAIFTALNPKPAYAIFTNLGGGRGELKLTPGFFDAGVDTVRLRAVDNGVPSASDTEFVEIIVNEKNAPPALTIAPSDSVKVYACCSLSILITATDIDSGPAALVLSASSLPAFGTLVDSGGGVGSLYFAPGEPEVGDYTVMVLATDSVDTTNSTVPVKVLPRGDLTGDGILTPADVVSELNCAFLGIPPPVSSSCDNCDFDGGGASASDVVLLLNAAFLGIALPAC